jgi:murein DD-endopeptidase MepM/ murein hydrolase activator NlpD
MTQDEVLAVAEIVERAAKRYNEQAAAHERTMQDDRMAFNARTEADRQIIEGLRADLVRVQSVVKAQSDHAKDAGKLLGWTYDESAFDAALRVVKERDQQRADLAKLAATLADSEAIAAEIRNQRDGLRIQVQDQRAEIERLRADIAEELNESPPAPPEASHDTPAGKEAAEAVIRDSQMTEIKAGDVVEVFQDTSENTLAEEIGIIGRVMKVCEWFDEQCVILDPETQNRPSDYLHYALCDVRKVPQ